MPTQFYILLVRSVKMVDHLIHSTLLQVTVLSSVLHAKFQPSTAYHCCPPGLSRMRQYTSGVVAGTPEWEYLYESAVVRL